jgi:hypothetical protein
MYEVAKTAFLRMPSGKRWGRHRHLAGIEEGIIGIAGQECGQADFGGVKRRIEFQAIDHRRPGAGIGIGLGEDDRIVRLLPALDFERAGGYDGLDIDGPVITKLINLVLGHGVPEAGDRWQVGFGGDGGDFDGEVVDSLEAEGRNVGSAFGDFLPALDAAGKIPIPGKIIA